MPKNQELEYLIQMRTAIYEQKFLKLMDDRQIEKKVSPDFLDGACLLCSEAKPHHSANGQTLRDAMITDPDFAGKLEAGYQPTGEYLVTVSLSMPWTPHDDWEGEAPCWKLIAGVIEI